MKKIFPALRLIIFSGILLSYFSCGNSSQSTSDTNEDKALLQQAADIHNEAIKIGSQVAPSIEELKQMRNGINIQGRALTPEEITFASQVDFLESSHDFWQQHLIEVPGFNHDHSGHDHGSHDHGSHQQEGVTLAPEQMLKAQEEIRDSIVMIRKRVEGLKERVKELQN